MVQSFLISSRNLLVAQLNQAYQIIFPDMQGYARQDLNIGSISIGCVAVLWICDMAILLQSRLPNSESTCIAVR